VSFIARFREIHAEVERQGIPAFDMRDEGHLELVYVGGSGGDADNGASSGESAIIWREHDSTRPREIRSASEPSPIRYFLDGSQRTLRALYCDNLPIIVGIVGAAILRRDDAGNLHVVQGMIGFKRVWVAPRHSDSADLNRLIEIIEDSGEEVVDPLGHFSPERYARELLDFGGIVEHSYKRVGKIRQELERWHVAD
jgi:hypothetical protein